ncbi:MAG TPA: twin-arginine translocase subunit TatC [Steroidobacteraceae bacterium]|nr:twin-arginine translocase subunit TatC [Steroidobacteraceae bacterium]
MSEEPEEPPEKLAEGTLISHLLELRNRLMRAGVAVLIALIPCAWKSNELFNLVAIPIKRQLPKNAHLIATDVLAPFMTPFKLSMYVALFIAMPYVLYQVWSFVAPGLYRHEKRFAIPLLVSSIILFYTGIAFAYFAVFPVVFRFMAMTTPPGVEMMTDITSYLAFVMKMFLAFGIAFEAPIAVVLLVATGLVSVEKLSSNRGYVVIGVFVIAAAVTPPDTISMTILALPMYLLYEIGLFFARIVAKSRREAEQREAKAQ